MGAQGLERQIAPTVLSLPPLAPVCLVLSPELGMTKHLPERAEREADHDKEMGEVQAVR